MQLTQLTQSLQSTGRVTTVSEPMEFEHVSDTLIVPLPAWRVLLAIEHAGHRLRVVGADILIEPGVGLDVHLLAELKRWKPHAIMLLGYTADDSHLRQLPVA